MRVLARGASDRSAARDQVRSVRGSVLDRATLVDAAKGCRLVLHLAGRVVWGEDAPDLFPLHVDGTRNVIAAAREAGVQRVVHVSTSGTVGISRDLDHVAHDGSAPAIEAAGRWPYYLSKIYAERLALEEHARGGIEVAIVNPALLLGPLAHGAPPAGASSGDPANGIVAKFMRSEIAAVPPGVASVIDVRDAAALVIAAGERARPGVRYLAGVNLSFDDLCEGLARATGVRKPLVRIPRGARDAMDRAATALEAVERWAGYTGEEAASLAMAGYSWAVDARLASQELGFRPRPLDETLRAAALAVEAAGEIVGKPQGLVSAALGGLRKLRIR